ncbi:MAG: GDSL-type esterase/lipase family protein [Candidatus Bathyarchaeota archaeon]|nr:GDSL-type esterase/lipase family protein [Chloroflexota bacterium]MCL5876390.1 GDSL-type esterase/lipase family protein [Candidatus Bathyarchaeota archaeon]
MNRTVKLLALAVTVLLVAASLEAVMLAAITNEQTPQSPVRVACVGDSITRGTEYTLYLWEKLGSNYVISDFGVGGVTVSLKSESAYMNTTAFELAKQFQPDIVVVMLGTNDADNDLNISKEQFISDYLSLLSEFQSLSSKPKVYIVLPPPIFENDANLNGTLLTQMIIPSISEVANVTGVSLVDAYTPLLDHPDYFGDGVHPKVEGAQVIADAVYSVLALDLSKEE